MSCGMDEICERVAEIFFENHSREPTDEEFDKAFEEYSEYLMGVAEFYYD